MGAVSILNNGTEYTPGGYKAAWEERYKRVNDPRKSGTSGEKMNALFGIEARAEMRVVMARRDDVQWSKCATCF